MHRYKCINKLRDKDNTIVAYELLGADGRIIQAFAADLKRQIKNRKVEVVNLKLTSDNRLISIDDPTNSTVDKIKFNDLVEKAYKPKNNNEKNQIDYLRNKVSSPRVGNAVMEALKIGAEINK